MERVKRAPKNEPHFQVDWRQLSYYYKHKALSTRLKSIGLSSNRSEHSEQISLDGESDITSTSGNKPGSRKQILNSLDGCFRSGELSAILGPSGAGKSTFLSSLFGEKQEGAYGQTKVTWFDQSSPEEVRLKNSRRPLRIACLPQHDHLLHHLTVYEALLFASKIKNTRNGQGKDKASRNFHRMNVRRVAKMLRLTDCLGTKCGKLSGGQYKRVSIGQELLSEPDIIILDEPTSGLDSMTCLSTIQTLKSIVSFQPMSIILTIHQPDVDVLNLFDHVYVIAQGGIAIFEGPPSNIMPTLAQVDLKAPYPNYNPARFIVEHAFVTDLSESEATMRSMAAITEPPKDSDDLFDSEHLSDSEDELAEANLKKSKSLSTGDAIKRSILSLTEALSGKEMTSEASNRSRKDKKPLLNLGVKTLDGHLITSEQLHLNQMHIDSMEVKEAIRLEQSARQDLIRRLNEIQKSRYYNKEIKVNCDDPSGKTLDKFVSPSSKTGTFDVKGDENLSDGYSFGCRKDCEELGSLKKVSLNTRYHEVAMCKSMSLADLHGPKGEAGGEGDGKRVSTDMSRLASPSSHMSLQASKYEATRGDLGLPEDEKQQNSERGNDSAVSRTGSALDHESSSSASSSSSFVANDYICLDLYSDVTSRFSTTTRSSGARTPSIKHLKRQFDKRLSSKNSSHASTDHPLWYHASILTHRTWLSIIRDPIFFGIQAFMHTTIPILLAFIFGSVQDEGCPKVGEFDIVEFAYSSSDVLLGTMLSIRRSVGNVGIMFFEMFVLCFAINCITALVFPSDMMVLLKEYRNGWYSLRSYLLGRTLADLPVPVVLHSVAIIMLYILTGQPYSLWRLSAIVLLVVMASLVAQSVGLTIGAILMKSSQSAVLAAAGIVAPFFALSGFIVRIHTLPWIAQAAAKGSYLYHLLNGFIVLRYGFGRCPCNEEDFDIDPTHKIPDNLNTMASLWVGTYSDEYAVKVGIDRNLTDPNIDVIGKLVSAFNTAKSFGHQIQSCRDVLPYAMLDFNIRDQDIYWSFLVIIFMIIASRCLTFIAIYYKIRSYS